MSQKVSADLKSNAYLRYAQYLSKAQNDIAEAITRTNSIRFELPIINNQISDMSIIREQLAQLLTDTSNAIGNEIQQDVINAENISAKLNINTSLSSEVFSFSGHQAGILGAIPFIPSLSDDLISAVVRNQHGSLPLAQTKGFVFEHMVARKSNLFNCFTRAKVLANNKTGQDILIKGLGKSSVIETKAGNSTYAYVIKKRFLNGDYPNGVTATKELANKLDDLGVKNVNSGISTAETERVAGLSRSSSSVGKFVTKSVLKNAGKAGALGAVIGGGIEAISGYEDYKNGTISGGQYANNIARESTAGFAGAAVTTVAIGALSVTALPGVAVAAVGIGVGVAVSAGVSWLWKKIAG